MNVQEVCRADAGISLPEHEHSIFPPEKIQLLTGDENFVNVEAIVQYKIKDAAKYLYKINFSAERLVRSAVEAEEYRTEVVNNARGKADRFSAMLAEYRKNCIL